MNVKEITRRDADGAIGTDAVIDLSEIEGLIDNHDLNLGDMGDEGMDNLVSLHNALSRFLLKTGGGAEQTSIKSARSYGMVYLIEHLLNRSIDIGSATFHSRELIPPLLAALLDEDLDARVDLERLKNQLYTPDDLEISVRSIRQLVTEFEDIDISPPVSTKKHCRSEFVDVSEQQIDLAREIGFKLNVWCTLLSKELESIYSSSGFGKLLNLALQLRAYIEDEVEMSWQRIQNHMRELRVVEVEDGAFNVVSTTRPTTKQLMILYRLGLDAPDSIIDHDRVESVLTDDIDLDFDAIMELLDR
ncbi:hypothetical protein ACFLQV_01715 [Calditrichota bacterium]